MSKATKSAADKPAKRSCAAPPPQAKAIAAPETAIYQVLEPFKFGDTVLKPPCWIEMTAAEAQTYQDAGVLGNEPGDVPVTSATDNNATSPHRACRICTPAQLADAKLAREAGASNTQNHDHSRRCGHGARAAP